MDLSYLKYADLVKNNYFLIKKFTELGIPYKYNGFYFLIDVVDAVLCEDKKIVSFSREIYPQVAQKYGKNDCSIERDIRNIINLYWDKTLKDKLYKFWDGDGKPTCCEFYGILKRYILFELS